MPATKPVQGATDTWGGKIFFTAWSSAFGDSSISKLGKLSKKDKLPNIDITGGDEDGLTQAQKLLTDNPGINGATLLNLLKSQGFQIVAPPTQEQVKAELPGLPTEAPKEADSAGANVAAVRDMGKKKKKESAKIRESLKSVTNFRETSARDNGIGATRYRVILIKEGLGNLRDAFYYGRESLETAVQVFEGKKCYANHPTQVEEQIRPERDVKEIIGHFENVALEEDDEGQSMLMADCCLMPDKQYEWARGLFRETVEYSKKYPDKDLVGLSINASGDAKEVKLVEFIKEASVPKAVLLKLQKAMEEGVETIRIVSKITEAMSCDLVTEAGAGGKIVKMLEKEKSMKMKQAEEKKEAAPAQNDPGHDDAAKDKDLIKQMLKKHLGDEEPGDAVVQSAHEAYQAAMKSGMEAEEAGDMVGKAMKCAKIMQACKPAEAKPEEAKDEEPKEDSKMDAKGLVVTEGEEHKEATSLLKLKGEIAALKESINKREVLDYVETKLSSSGVARSHTKTIRESLDACRSKAEVDQKIKMFLEGYKAGGEAGQGGLIVGHEKTGSVEAGVSFADCVE